MFSLSAKNVTILHNPGWRLWLTPGCRAAAASREPFSPTSRTPKASTSTCSSLGKTPVQKNQPLSQYYRPWQFCTGFGSCFNLTQYKRIFFVILILQRWYKIFIQQSYYIRIEQRHITLFFLIFIRIRNTALKIYLVPSADNLSLDHSFLSNKGNQFFHNVK